MTVIKQWKIQNTKEARHNMACNTKIIVARRIERWVDCSNGVTACQTSNSTGWKNTQSSTLTSARVYPKNTHLSAFDDAIWVKNDTLRSRRCRSVWFCACVECLSWRATNLKNWLRRHCTITSTHATCFTCATLIKLVRSVPRRFLNLFEIESRRIRYNCQPSHTCSHYSLHRYNRAKTGLSQYWCVLLSRTLWKIYSVSQKIAP